MGQAKALYIAEKPSVALAFAQALKITGKRADGFIESENAVVTWCYGHLVMMSYPEAYDAALKKWSLSTIPFLPERFRYEIIPQAKKQFNLVSRLLNREDIGTVYVCTDAGREGEYIYRLVEQMAHPRGKERRRVWIDSQTEEEILRGIREARALSDYDALAASAYLRAKEDYLMGINFSRALTLRYANTIKKYLNIDKCVIAVGRVMTCVLGMAVTREREIRHFVKTPYYGVEGRFCLPENTKGSAEEGTQDRLSAAWKAVPGSRYHESPLLYNEKGFRAREDAQELIRLLGGTAPAETGAQHADAKDGKAAEYNTVSAVIEKAEKKKEKKNPPLLYNLAELQNDCARYFKISPDQTLQIAQELYEKKMTTYPRTDARVMSTAVAKEIEKNIRGLEQYPPLSVYAKSILQHGTHKTIHKTRYVNDKQVTDHYCILPTGQGTSGIEKLNPLSRAVYELVARRFLAVFFPPAQYDKISLTVSVSNQANEITEYFFTNFRFLSARGYLHVLEKPKQGESRGGQAERGQEITDASDKTDTEGKKEEEEQTIDAAFMERLKGLKKGSKINIDGFEIKEGETSPPRRYNSGTMILAMENAGQLIEDEELRAQIKGAGIGTSATRAEILKKLVSNRYLSLNKKTQIITPTQTGEMIYEAVLLSMPSMLKPALTASWEKGLAQVADGMIGEAEYMEKLEGFIRRQVEGVKQHDHGTLLQNRFDDIAPYYTKR